MKKIILFFATFLVLTFSMVAQIKMIVHLNDAESIEVYASSVDSITFTNFPVEPDDNEENDDPVYDGSFVAKSFSVSETKTVTFSPGNLQYHAANDEWRFAPNQTDYIGEDNVNINSTYNGWIDLFGWGTGNNPTNAVTDYYEYQTFVDWGVNKIGNYAPNTWRTLTKDEWEYIISGRANATNLMGVAEVEGVNGLILLPDNWTCPSDVTFKSGTYDGDRCIECFGYYQKFGASEWEKLEASGVVFLPISGARFESTILNMLDYGAYWAATDIDPGAAYDFFFTSSRVTIVNNIRYYGQSVRLVRESNNNTDNEDTGDKPVKPDEGEDSSVNANGHEYVDLGLPSGTLWATMNIGATAAENYGNYYAWGEITTKSSYTSSNYTYSSNPATLPLSKDVASVSWGGDWRMPTQEELDELLTECTWTWAVKNGLNGYNVTGSNGNSIFLPAAGYRYNSDLKSIASSGFYWSSSICSSNSDNAYALGFNSGYIYWTTGSRDYARSVRPVLSAK